MRFIKNKNANRGKSGLSKEVKGFCEMLIVKESKLNFYGFEYKLGGCGSKKLKYVLIM